MDDGFLSPGTMLDGPSDSAMDVDYMDELLLEGCWLETDGSEFLPQTPFNSNSLFDPFFGWPPVNTGDLSTNPAPNTDQHEQERQVLNDTTPFLSQNAIDVAGCSGQTENQIIEGSEVGRRWWIGHPGPGCSVTERLIRAVGYIKDSSRDKDVLVQVWVPINSGGKRVLTTNDLPFCLNTSCTRLARYRDISMSYQFSAEENSKDVMGLPGRVFLGKVPEWTPDVRYFRSDEYPRVRYAQQCDVRGTLALPVFDQGSRTCLGVIEVVMTTQQIKYGAELENVCKALEAVHLRSSDALSSPHVKVFYRSYGAILLEIRKVLRFACKTHRLPLAQTWASCIQQGREGCRHSDENYNRCVSTVDQACYVREPGIQNFHEACSEHHLLKGQGVAGEAFLTNKPCFSSDIKSFGNTEYPLSHHARMFELHAAVAIRLRSIHARKADFVLEFFLPVGCTDPEEQRKLLSSLSIIIQQSCHSFRIVTDEELREERDLPFAQVVVPLNGTPSKAEGQVGDNPISLFPDEKPAEVLKAAECSEECLTFGEHSSSNAGMEKTGEKRRNKAEKTITLQVLQQYFAGSLKDAAKSIGVCPTTLKRVCRQHGIQRWPSRKIKKVGHSLQKLQHVINSVQGTSGAFEIGSLYNNFPDLASPNLSGTSPFLTLNTGTAAGDGIINPKVAPSKSASSSCSQSSGSSSLCFSSRTHADAVIGENPGEGELKKVKSEAELNVSIQEGIEIPRRSQSHKSLNELRPGMKNNRQMSEEEDAQRVKVTYGDDKIRLRLHRGWGYEDLRAEIGRRFNINDMSKYDLKYLDDDSEWVLLTCDADMEECIDVYRASQSQTIKLSLQVSRFRSSIGSSFLS